MYFKCAKVISLILFALYYYKMNGNKLLLYVLLNVIFITISAFAFQLIFPTIPLNSPALEYLGFIAIVGISTLAMIILIAKEVEKQRNNKTIYESEINSVFKLNKQNIIFWSIIMLIDITAYLLDK